MVGSFMGQVFTVSQFKIITPKNIQGSAGSDWAVHELIGRKSRSQWIGPKLRSYTMDILLRAQDGINPRKTLDLFQAIAESDKTDYFVIGGTPLSPNPFKLTSVSDAWNAVLNGGVLVECEITLNIEEYL
ncbi:MAG: phage tail protein [Muribaculaceae bacterium]|nr:phage tail protein [Muribaculaceae bacterium]MCM1439329.1 phage tail protein [Roseburia sp.]